MRAIDDGLQRAPNALYPLVQTVLVQDEALKRADARIRELEQELGIEPEQPAQQGGFLDSMRDTLLGGASRKARCRALRPRPRPSRDRWAARACAPQRRRASSRHPQPGYCGRHAAAGSRRGGSFLGTAAATAAGVIGGALLMNSFRGMFGGQHGMGSGHGQGAGQGFGSGGQGGTPWAPDSGGDLARQAGLDDIGRGGGGGSPGGDSRTAPRPVRHGTERHADSDDEGGDDDFEGADDFGDDTDTA